MRKRWLIQTGRKIAGQPDASELQLARADIREAPSFRRMGAAIRKQQKELIEEQRITAFFGVRTSWSRIANADKYAVVSESTFTRRKAA